MNPSEKKDNKLFDYIRTKLTTTTLQNIFANSGVKSVSDKEWNNHVQNLPKSNSTQRQRIQTLIDRTKYTKVEEITG